MSIRQASVSRVWTPLAQEFAVGGLDFGPTLYGAALAVEADGSFAVGGLDFGPTLYAPTLGQDVTFDVPFLDASPTLYAPDVSDLVFVSAAIPAAGDTIALTYSGSKASSDSITLLSNEGAVTGTYSSGEGTTTVTYTLSRVVSSTDTILLSVGGTIYDVTNNSTETRPALVFALTKLGTIEATEGGAFYPSLVDTRGVANWPWDVSQWGSTDHGSGGIYMRGSQGSPLTLANWESYNTSRGEGDFSAFATKPTSGSIVLNVGTQQETPTVRLVGSEYLMTTHDFVGTGDQPTRLYIAETPTDAPLNFAQYTGVTGGRILDSTVTEYPGDGHRGYFRWI